MSTRSEYPWSEYPRSLSQELDTSVKEMPVERMA